MIWPPLLTVADPLPPPPMMIGRELDQAEPAPEIMTLPLLPALRPTNPPLLIAMPPAAIFVGGCFA